jgi:regulator of protease activity HflC (stomatin/prohibitin superfamily)
MKQIRTTQVGILESFGRFSRVCQPGLNFYLPFVQRIHVMECNIATHLHEFSVKTRDNAFARISTAVLLQVHQPEQAFYSLKQPNKTLDAFLEDNVRSVSTSLTLDQLFESKEGIQQSASARVRDAMAVHGWTVRDVMLKSIEPDDRVRVAMNEINAARRLRDAALEKAEADKAAVIKAAEGEKERRRLQGEGIAEQRSAIFKGMERGVTDLARTAGMDAKSSVVVALMSQYYDALEKMAAGASSRVVYAGHSPASVAESLAQMRGLLDLSADSAALSPAASASVAAALPAPSAGVSLPCSAASGC